MAVTSVTAREMFKSESKFRAEIGAMDFMNKRSKWLTFSIWDATDKTVIISVRPKENKTELLGFIKWFGRWRCYAFFPSPDCVFEQQCLRDIARLEIYLMSARKKLKTK
jgi:hypothetical protein